MCNDDHMNVACALLTPKAIEEQDPEALEFEETKRGAGKI
jgi:hypothetical protein